MTLIRYFVFVMSRINLVAVITMWFTVMSRISDIDKILCIIRYFVFVMSRINLVAVITMWFAVMSRISDIDKILCICDV